MKIYAIRGENIASLAGSFEIEMEKGILGQSGLFAITGPTGAGKSTLLDAMCLALYDRIPRFDLTRSIEVGRFGDPYREKANDVKTIMHKGASSCFAEVDFLGSDTCLYKARWFARRSRDKADGRLQMQTLSLVNLDTGKEWAGKKTDVLQSIERRVGLTFDQFRRSVLLAQGDFAAFLKSNDGERAELLEKMTGSEIYAEISRQAYERNKEEQQVLKELEIRKTGIGLLDDDRKKEIEGILRDLTKKQADIEKKQIQLQNILFLESDRKEKNRHYIESNERVEKEEIKQGNLHSLLKTSEEEFASRKILLREAEKQAREIKPDIDKAREFDAFLQKSSLQLSDLKRQYQKKFLLAETAEKQARENEKNQKTLLTDREKKRKWLDENRHLEKLSPLLDIILRDIEGFRSSGKKLEKAEEDKKHFEKQKGTLNAEIRKREVQDQQFEKTLKTINLDVEKAEKETETLSREGLIKERNQLFVEKETLGIIEKTAARMIEKDHLQKEFSGNLKKAEKDDVKCKDQILKLQKKLPEMTGCIKELETSLRDAELAVGLEDKRRMLTPGKSCPLCGSENHPWTDGSPLPALLSGFRVRLEESKQQHAELLKTLSAETEKEKHLMLDIKDFHQSLESIKSESIELKKTMNKCLSNLPDVYKNELDHKIPIKELIGVCHTFLAGIKKKVTLNEQTEKHLNALEETYKGLARKREKIKLQADKNRETIQENRKKLAECVEKLNQTIITFEKENQIREDTHARISKEFPEHRSLERELAINSSGFSKSLKSDVGRYTETTDQIKETEAQLNMVSHELTRLKEEAKQLGKGASEALSNLNEEKKTKEILLTERNQLLHGKTVVDMEKIITETVKKAALDIEKKRKMQEKIRADLSESKGIHKTAVADLKKWKREFITADRKLNNELKKNKLLDDKDRIDALVSGLKGDMDGVVHEIQKHRVILENDADNLKKVKTFQEEIEEKTEKAQVWAQINLLIGSADGAKFRKFAQGLTLDLLIGYANRYLKDLSRRYVLERVPGQDLEIQIRDQEMGDEIRSASSLSGGESFLVSLALALGLSGMTSATVSVESLFVDEGFGTLDPETLETALAALDNLQATGRKVGVISHVQGLAEHIGAQVMVEKAGAGRSIVRTLNV